MTPAHIKLAIAGGIALIGWLLGEKPATATVDLGVGTVNGVYGGDYMTPAAPGSADASNPAVDPTMRALINQSNQAIAADNAAHSETGAIL